MDVFSGVDLSSSRDRGGCCGAGVLVGSCSLMDFQSCDSKLTPVRNSAFEVQHGEPIAWSLVNRWSEAARRLPACESCLPALAPLTSRTVRACAPALTRFWLYSVELPATTTPSTRPQPRKPWQRSLETSQSCLRTSYRLLDSATSQPRRAPTPAEPRKGQLSNRSNPNFSTSDSR